MIVKYILTNVIVNVTSVLFCFFIDVIVQCKKIADYFKAQYNWKKIRLVYFLRADYLI